MSKHGPAFFIIILLTIYLSLAGFDASLVRETRPVAMGIRS